MLLKDHDLFIFDWDGTLSSSTALVKSMRLVELRYSVNNILNNKDAYKIDTTAKLVRKEGESRWYSIFYNFYAFFSRPKIKRDAFELLKYLRSKGKKIAIFSDSNQYRLMIEARRLGIHPYVDFVLSAYSVDRFKPDPTGLAIIADYFKVPRKRCVYVGDMAVDMFAGKFAGMVSCGVYDGVDPVNILKECKPNYVFSDLGNMLKGLKSGK